MISHRLTCACWRFTLAALAAGVLAFAPVRPAFAEDGASRPQRIVSLNLCVDQIVLGLVERERIAGVSFLASDPSMSLFHREARGIPSLRGSAEEVIGLNPDLVLAGEWTTTATVDLLRRLGRRVEVVPMASSFEAIRDLVRTIARLTGAHDRGERMIRDFDQRLAGVRTRAPAGERARAVAIQVNSLAAVPGSLLNEAIETAGYVNQAAIARLGPGGRLPLESLLADPPDLIVLANSAADFRTVLGDNLRHPAFIDLQSRRPGVHVPLPEWLCGTPRILDAVERINAHRMRVAHPAAAP